MAALNFKRFTRPQLLLRIGRPLLTEFLKRFEPELTAAGLALPPPEVSEPEWATGLSRLFCGPEHLPDSLCQALYAIDEMATADGQEQLERALVEAGVTLGPAPGASRQDLALQTWLTAPELLTRLHNRQRLLRLTSFEYFGGAAPDGGGAGPAWEPPDAAGVARMAADLDDWFARHHRGRNTTRVELYIFTLGEEPGAAREYWFLVRHGDTFSRAPKVEEQRTEVLHFRPQRDDVVVWSTARDELRINARTRGEKELYVRTFGLHLRGSPDYFRRRQTYTLEPLRELGRDALETGNVPGLARVVWRRVEELEEGADRVVTHEAGDLFAAGERRGGGLGPGCGHFRSADFDLHFAGCRRPRTLQIRLPNMLKLRRHCDLHVIEPLLARFRRLGNVKSVEALKR